MTARVYVYIQSDETLSNFQSAAMKELKKAHGDTVNRWPHMWERIQIGERDGRTTIYFEFETEEEAAIWKLTYL